MKQLRKFLHLTRGERRLLLRAVVLLLAIRLGLWMLSFQNLRGILERLKQQTTAFHTADSSLPDRIAWAVAVASHYVPGTSTCLAQALAAQVLLRAEGYPAHLTLGVAGGKETPLEAHAWVESQGKIVVGGAAHERYHVLSTLDEERA